MGQVDAIRALIEQKNVFEEIREELLGLITGIDIQKISRGTLNRVSSLLQRCNDSYQAQMALPQVRGALEDGAEISFDDVPCPEKTVIKKRGRRSPRERVAAEVSKELSEALKAECAIFLTHLEANKNKLDGALPIPISGGRVGGRGYEESWYFAADRNYAKLLSAGQARPIDTQRCAITGNRELGMMRGDKALYECEKKGIVKLLDFFHKHHS